MSIKKRGVSLLQYSKAQAAIFLIIAALIILSGVLYFLYQRQAVEKEIEVVQPEIVPIKSYVQNCIKAVAEDGLEIVGLSGGYINVPEKISINPKAYFATFASGFKMPYWWYDGISSIPTEEFISQQLRSHIKNELSNCINNFEPFLAQFEINELKEPVVDVRFNENDVSVTLKYPLEIIAKDNNFKALAENFVYVVPIRFKKVYELASSIMGRENKDFFLERRTIELYSLDTEIPTTDVEARCNAKIWRLGDIRQRLQTLLRVNIPYIRIKGTDYNPNLYVPDPSGKNRYSETYFQQHYVWEIDKDAEKKYNNMKVAFTYDSWPLSIYARPSENGMLRSNAQKGTELLKFLCLHIWHFTYDISYPVLVTIFDQETNKNKAYQFSFPFKVSIDHNIPSRANKGATLFEALPDLSSDEYCNDVQNEVTIFTVDNATTEDIRGVNMTFVCGRYYCDIGQSDWLSLGAAAGITKRLPFCFNGIIKGAKGGYADTSLFIQTDIDGSYVLALDPIKEFQNYKVVKHLLSNPSDVRELSQNDKASIFIKGKDIGFESFAVYPREAELPLKLAGKDAIYEVTIYLFDEDNLIGGYVGDWQVSKDALANANEIVFHVIEQGQASEDEKFLFITGMNTYSANVPAPELK